MRNPELPSNEKERLEDLFSYDLLDNLEQKEFNAIVELASDICKTPISIITLLDTDKQWFKANVGMDVKFTDRNISFCGHAIVNPERPLVVEDARLDERFESNPLVMDDPNIVFYAGFPLVTNEGHGLGTLCVIDRKPRKLDEVQTRFLTSLSQQVVRLFELRKMVKQLESSETKLQENIEKLNEVKSSLKVIEISTELLQKENLENLEGNNLNHIENIQKESRASIDLINKIS